MTKTTLLTGLLFVGTTLGFSACGPIVPVSPTWETDVRPLLVARCIRCHDDPGRVDPASKATGNVFLSIPAVPNMNYQRFGDIPAGPPPLPDFLSPIKRSGQAARGELPYPRMPPSPAEALEDWQIEMLDAWAFAPR